MSSHYSSTPYSNPPAYVPKSPTYDPNHDSREGISAASGPYMPTTQYNTNAYGRQQQPGPALHRGGSELRPSQPGHPQYQPDQTAQPYRPNEQYRHDVNPGPSTPRHASIDMARVSSAGSYGTENESPQSYNPAEGPKERPWICMYPGCLNNGHLTSFTRKDDLNRHLRVHMPYRELYPCPVPGCDRVGDNGLPRKDKLIEHVKTHQRRR